MIFTLRNLFKTKNLFASLFLVFISSLAMAQGGGLETGAVIVLSSKGLVEVTDPKGKIITKTLKPGMVLAEGFTIRTGITGEMSALFSNGMTATIERQTILKISTFLQEPLQGANQTIEQTVDEPGPTTLALALDVGSLIVESKKLNKDSSFQIQTRVGTAGIQGTQFQLSQQRGGACKLDVSSSVVSFSSANNPQPILIAEGQGMDASPDGNIQSRPIDPIAKTNITRRNQAAAKIAAKVSFAVLKEASGKAKSIAPGTSGSSTSPSPANGSTKDSDEMNKPEDDSEGADEKDMRGSLLNQSKLDLRSVGGAEVINIINKSRASELFTSVSLEIDEKTGETIVNYLDEVGNVIKSETASEELFEELKSSSDSIIDTIATEVFLEQVELGFTYEKGVNSALQEAIRIAKSILANVSLSNSLPSANTWNASDLVYQFSANPYAYEFALILTRYGALGDKNNNNHSDTIDNIGLKIIDLLGGREKLKDQNHLKDILEKSAKPGESFNGLVLDGELLGTRSANLSEEDAENLDLQVDRVVGLLGSNINITANAELDPSTLAESDTTQVFAIAAAKDVIIEGDLNFKNDQESDQAIAIGAADDLHFRSRSVTDYFDSDFAGKYLDSVSDPIFLSESPHQPAQSPTPISITNNGSDFGIGSYDRLELIDLDISTKGNLAIGSLDELKILSTRFDESKEFSNENLESILDLNTLSAGTDGQDDRVFLYAHNRIAANGLGFGKDVREIYMDAITIDLKNVKFPDASQVMLKSRLGSPTFGSSAREIGKVNFIKNVYHGNDAVKQGFFSNDPTMRNSNKIVDGTPAIRIRPH